MTGTLPYFLRNFPEKTVKHDADKTPTIIKKSPLKVLKKLLSTFSEIQNETPIIASKTAIDLFIVICSILKK